MRTTPLPSRSEMLRAFATRDAAYEGIFVTAVRTTGIFCRPSCSARKPRPENVDFYGTSREALLAGFRPCRRCRPLEPLGDAPAWLAPLLERVEAEPQRRWRDRDLRALGISPERARRWFQRHHGLSFHGYSRSRRLGEALGRIQAGAPVTRVAFDSGFESLAGFADAFARLTGTSPGAGKKTARLVVARLPTPLGPMVAASVGGALCLLEFADRPMLPTQLARAGRAFGGVLVPGSSEVLDLLARELVEYFDGRRRAFEVPLAIRGTPFQERVWRALAEIPFGATASYAAVARRIGAPAATRAVARANGDNRIAIVVPCHRVIGSDGRLTGYGGGLWRKQRLLAIEGHGADRAEARPTSSA